MVLGYYGIMVLCGMIELLYYGIMGIRAPVYYGIMVLVYYGVMVIGYYGIMVLWVLWYESIMVLVY